MALVKTTIDGREVEVERDRWALEVAREMGIEIPSLCHHAAMAPYGACRLCVVEVTRGKWTWLTTSCDLPIREGLSIRTDTPAVVKARKMALELMWAEAPDAAEVRELARQMGLQKPRFAPRSETGKCILCGLCVRVCRDLMGLSAICFSNRGPDRTIGAPFDGPSETCIGCMACVAVCPTGAIRTVDCAPGVRMDTFNTNLELAECEACGRPFAPVKHLQYVRDRLPEHVPLEAVCPACRRRRSAGRFSVPSSPGEVAARP